MQEMAAHRDRFEARVLELVPGSVVNKPADPAHRVWNTTSIAFPRLEAEVLLLMLQATSALPVDLNSKFQP